MGPEAVRGLTRRAQPRARPFLSPFRVDVTFPHRIIFVRHGETPYNAENRLQGQRDIALSPRGRDQAHAVGRTLRARIGDDIDRLESAGAFVASPLLRARETMELVRSAMDLPAKPYRLDAGLMEISFGAWEGFTWAELRGRDPKGVAARRADRWGFVPPGGESYQMLKERLRPWLAALDGDMFVVAHGGVARALMAMLCGVPGDTAAGTPIAQGRALIFADGGCEWIE